MASYHLRECDGAIRSIFRRCVGVALTKDQSGGAGGNSGRVIFFRYFKAWMPPNCIRKNIDTLGWLEKKVI